MKLVIFYTTIICILFLSTSNAGAQTLSAKTDPAGYIQKYDSLFNGIGPQVYFLPAPRSKADILQDQFNLLVPFTDTIMNVIVFQDILLDFTNAANNTDLKSILTVNQLDLNKLTSDLIAQSESNEETISLFNEIAKQYMLQHELAKAELILLEGIKFADNRTLGKTTLQKNLTALYLYNKDYTKAEQLAEELTKQNKKNKANTERAQSLVTLAKIQALTGDLKTAESTMIRKALPIFENNKDYNNKIKGWIVLAQLYILHKKYPEAQWFLIQAQELAEKKNIPQYNSTIEYLLGSSKFYQSNFAVAKKELTKAFDLAKKSEDKYLELATTQMLAGVNIKLNETEQAEYFLKSYWNLRNELF